MSTTHVLKLDSANAFISPKTAAKALDVSVWFVYRLIKEKKIKSYRVGKCVRLKSEDFKQWADFNVLGN